MTIKSLGAYFSVVFTTAGITWGAFSFISKRDTQDKDQGALIQKQTEVINDLSEKIDTLFKMIPKIDAIQADVNELKESNEGIRKDVKTTATSFVNYAKSRGLIDNKLFDILAPLTPIIYEKKNELTQELNETQLDENGMLNLK